MAAACPPPACAPTSRPSSCTELARRQRDAGHLHFTCATVREMEGMAAAGLDADLLLANEVVDAGPHPARGAGLNVTVAVTPPRRWPRPRPPTSSRC